MRLTTPASEIDKPVTVNRTFRGDVVNRDDRLWGFLFHARPLLALLGLRRRDGVEKLTLGNGELTRAPLIDMQREIRTWSILMETNFAAKPLLGLGTTMAAAVLAMALVSPVVNAQGKGGDRGGSAPSATPGAGKGGACL
jgi:hypothetical protein